MNTINTLPENMVYYPSSKQKVDGKRKMVLDLSRSTVQVVPENLKGVDCLLVRRGQIKYLAPDYFGDVVWMDISEPGKIFRTAMSDGERRFLIRCYQVKKNKIPDFFENSSRNKDKNNIDEEILPPNLTFSWDYEKNTGKLDARRTALTWRPHIANVNVVLMPANVNNRAVENINDRT